MTTYQLAALLDNLRVGFGDNLKAAAGTELSDLSAAFRELPDQSLREFIKNARAPAPARAKKGAVSIDLPNLIDRLRSVRQSPPGTAVEEIDLDALKLNNAQLREILKAFGEKPTTGVAGNTTKVRRLLEHRGAESEPAARDEPDPIEVEDGVRAFNYLLEDRRLSVPEVQAGFEPFRNYSKAVLEEISRRVGYTPIGTRADILERLRKNLEGIKMSQHRADRILTGTSG